MSITTGKVLPLVGKSPPQPIEAIERRAAGKSPQMALRKAASQEPANT